MEASILDKFAFRLRINHSRLPNRLRLGLLHSGEKSSSSQRDCIRSVRWYGVNSSSPPRISFPSSFVSLRWSGVILSLPSHREIVSLFLSPLALQSLLSVQDACLCLCRRSGSSSGVVPGSIQSGTGPNSGHCCRARRASRRGSDHCRRSCQ